MALKYVQFSSRLFLSISVSLCLSLLSFSFSFCCLFLSPVLAVLYHFLLISAYSPNSFLVQIGSVCIRQHISRRSCTHSSHVWNVCQPNMRMCKISRLSSGKYHTTQKQQKTANLHQTCARKKNVQTGKRQTRCDIDFALNFISIAGPNIDNI